MLVFISFFHLFQTDDAGAALAEEVGEPTSATAESPSMTQESEPQLCTDQMVSVHIPPIEYMLGLADLTGELMRMAISSVGQGNLAVPYEHCAFMRTIHDAFVSYGNVSRELVKKVSTLRQSLCKVENACYTLQVRGSEIPKHMLAEVFTSGHGEPPVHSGYHYENTDYD